MRKGKHLSAIQRYALASLCVVAALEIPLFLQRFGFRNVEFPLFLFAVAATAWYLGTGPMILAPVSLAELTDNR